MHSGSHFGCQCAAGFRSCLTPVSSRLAQKKRQRKAQPASSSSGRASVGSAGKSKKVKHQVPSFHMCALTTSVHVIVAQLEICECGLGFRVLSKP